MSTDKVYKCPECGTNYSTLNRFFNRNKARPNGYDRRCRPCERLRNPEKKLKKELK